jgi:hypothetical protein
MHLAHYLGLLHRSQGELADAFRQVADAHVDEPDVAHECKMLAGQSERHQAALQPFVERYGEDAPEEPEQLHQELFGGTRSGGLGLLRDLHDLYLMATECDISWVVIGQASQAAHDRDLLDTVHACEGETKLQLKWLTTRIKQAAAQALVAAR